ncbi:kinase-like domain-containing protein [Lineolata rhizophorae]|uniref:Kinase-like domain-containing protein n=1 Tax=Lineolata rhizophorae TaxID=578093 RepID=A0A6A6NS28_9PEZI|nr:kinase-like domain-containing protein [Lineolata rhizophorae]
MTSTNSSFEPTSGISSWDWANRGTSHVTFSKHERVPLVEGRNLGHGVNGPVYETQVKGVRLAWKRKFCRRKIGGDELKEIEIIKKLSHIHAIRLAGSYTHGPYLGLLLYPVAQCDLATFLEDVDFLSRLSKGLIEKPSSDDIAEHSFRCCQISNTDPALTHLNLVVDCAKSRLWRILGCTASAVDYLHQNRIRHKDLKPLNILLSQDDGLWVTDFGHSVDVSNFSDSATSGGELGTLKYCAPEVAAYERSGRSADMFSLGCIFFEITALSCLDLRAQRGLRSRKDGSFHNNLDAIFEVFETFGSSPLDHLPMALARMMLSKNPESRPSSSEVCQIIHFLSSFFVFEPDVFQGFGCVHGLHRPTPNEKKSTVQEITIFIGNTSHEDHREFVVRYGEKRYKQPSVFFVEISSPDLIESVIFFQHSSSDEGVIVFPKPPFARRAKLWGTYTEAVVLVLKQGFWWDSQQASWIPGQDGGFRSILPLTWELQLHSPMESEMRQERICS